MPEGHSRVDYRGRPYGLSVGRHGDGRTTKLYAEALDGGGAAGRDVYGANVYHLSSGDRLFPCEMAEEAVIAFLNGFEPSGAEPPVPGGR